MHKVRVTYGHAENDEATLLRGQIAAPDVRAQNVDARWRIPSMGVEDPRLAQVGLDPGTSLNRAGDDPQERRCAFRHSDDVQVVQERRETLIRPQGGTSRD